MSSPLSLLFKDFLIEIKMKRKKNRVEKKSILSDKSTEKKSPFNKQNSFQRLITGCVMKLKVHLRHNDSLLLVSQFFFLHSVYTQPQPFQVTV